MTNLEFYPKTADAMKAWVAYCKNLIMHSSDEPKAFDVWCSQECFDAPQPKTESKKRRPFTDKELYELIRTGPHIVGVLSMNNLTVFYELLTRYSVDVMRIGVCKVNGYDQDEMIEKGFCLDGEPWGVAEGGAK